MPPRPTTARRKIIMSTMTYIAWMISRHGISHIAVDDDHCALAHISIFAGMYFVYFVFVFVAHIHLYTGDTSCAWKLRFMDGYSEYCVAIFCWKIKWEKEKGDDDDVEYDLEIWLLPLVAPSVPAKGTKNKKVWEMEWSRRCSTNYWEILRNL